MDSASESDTSASAHGRPRRQATRRARDSMKKAIRALTAPNDEAAGPQQEDWDDNDNDNEHEDDDDEEEEEEEDEDEGLTRSPHRSNSSDMHALERGAMVRVLRTSDVEQRVPHTVGKIGRIEEVPQHPNTWFKVRIRDGDSVYKYRPSALQVVASGAEDEDGDIEMDAVEHEEEESGEGEHSDMVDDEEEEGEVSASGRGKLEVDTRVRVQVRAPSRRDRELKKHDRKLGVVISHDSDGVKVRLDSEEVVTMQVKHLVIAKNAPVIEPPSAPDSDNDLPKGQLLSELDPEMWIDRKCRINVGKFKGKHGRVLRSGNGWVQLRLENSSENTAKRAYELTLLEDMETIEQLYAKSLEKERRRRDKERANAAAAPPEPESDHAEASHSSADEASLTDIADDDSVGKRSRRSSTRASYGISWIDRKVQLPNHVGVGVVKRADRETCWVEMPGSKVLKVFKKKELELVEDEASKNSRSSRTRHARYKDRLVIPEGVKLMGTTPARYVAFQDMVKRFVMRRREYIKRRPYIQGHHAQLKIQARSSGDRDRQDPNMVDLLVVPTCEICGFEIEELQGECWNLKCPRSPGFDVESFDRNEEDAIARFPMVPLTNPSITNAIWLKDEAAVRKRRRQGGMSENGDGETSGSRRDSVKSDGRKTRKETNRDRRAKKRIGRSSPMESNAVKA